MTKHLRPWQLQITKKDDNDDQTLTTFRFDDPQHAQEDFIAECSLQAKYRAKIKGMTIVKLFKGKELLYEQSQFNTYETNTNQE